MSQPVPGPATASLRAGISPNAWRALARCARAGLGFVGLAMAAVSACAQPAAVPAGGWGGAHIRMTVTATGATIEYDCANGVIDAVIRPDAAGNFLAQGTHTIQRGGPVGPNDPRPRALGASYRGWTDGKDMRLTVSIPETGREIGSFTLRFSNPGQLERCV